MVYTSRGLILPNNMYIVNRSTNVIEIENETNDELEGGLSVTGLLRGF